MRTPVGVSYAESDSLHGAEAIQKLCDALPTATSYECPTNLYLHRADVISELDRFLETV